jgi:hypothetical protein
MRTTRTGLLLFRGRPETNLGDSIYYLPPSDNKLCAELVSNYAGTIVDKPNGRGLEVAIGPKDSLDY